MRDMKSLKGCNMRVLVALDTSETGESAAIAIAAWARSIELEVHLLSVLHPHEIHSTTEKSISGEFIEPPNTEHGYVPSVSGSQSGDTVATRGDPMPRIVETRGQALERAKSSREAYLRGVVDRHFAGTKVSAHVEFSDHTPESILEMAKTLDADAVAMGTHGRSGIGHALMGSVAEHVMRKSAVPVILTGPGMNRGLAESPCR